MLKNERTFCQNCGCQVYNGACTNCHEEIYIEQQYNELLVPVPKIIKEKADKQKKQIKLNSTKNL